MTLISPMLQRIGTGYEGINQTHIQSKLRSIKFKWEMDFQRFWEYRDSIYCPWYKSRLVCFCSKLNLKDDIAWRSLVCMDGKFLERYFHILRFLTVFRADEAVSDTQQPLSKGTGLHRGGNSRENLTSLCWNGSQQTAPHPWIFSDNQEDILVYMLTSVVRI